MSDCMGWDDELDAGVPCGTVYTDELEVGMQVPPKTVIKDRDVVNHPSHYTQGSIEVIDFITDQNMNYLEGNIIKYVSRYKYKNGTEDLEKAKWYVDKLIEQHGGK